MSNNLPALLAELATVAPDVCQLQGIDYKIGCYLFGFSKTNGEFLAWYDLSKAYLGSPAYDWLIGALQRVIEAKGLYDNVGQVDGRFTATINSQDNINDRWYGNAIYGNGKSRAEALLTALIAAMKGE